MRSITIVGAGQAGLQLGIGLLKYGYNVTLISNKTADEILHGQITSNQGMFDTALQHERDLGLNFYESQCPYNESVTFTVADNRKKAIHWKGFVDKPFQAVDQRLKFSRWLNEFESLQGCLIIKEVTLFDLEKLSQECELLVVASGKGEISQAFERDNEKSVFDKPARSLACHYVHGMKPITQKPGICANLIPGIGEYFTMPGLTISGHCEMMLFEGIPGGEFDCWSNIKHPHEQLEKSLSLLKKYLPWEAERCINIELTDEKATLKGSYTPVIRKPFFRLKNSGRLVLGIADTIVLNDPAAGQGANNASKSAKLYLDSIISQKNKPFDENWMQDLFNRYWEYAKWATQWTNLLLTPPTPHAVELLCEAMHNQKIANKISNGFNNPSDLFPWVEDETLVKKMISSLQKKFFEEKNINSLKAEEV